MCMSGQIGSCWQGITGVVSLSVGFALLIVFFLLLRSHYKGNRKPFWLVVVSSLATILLILGSSTIADFGYQQAQNEMNALFIFWFLLAVIFLAAFFIGMARVLRGGETPDWLKHTWTIEKGLGGSAFGDFANTIGVLAGVGALAVSFVLSWFLVGLLGALLATLVGFSLLFRWLSSDENNEQSRKFSGLLNIVVGLFTFISVTAPQLKTMNNQPLVPVGLESDFLAGNALPVYIVSMIVLVVLLVTAVVAFIFHLRHRNTSKRSVTLVWLGVIGLLIVTIVILNFYYWRIPYQAATIEGVQTFYDFAKVGAYVFGLLAALAWIGAELQNVIEEAISSNNLDPGLPIFSIIKSILEIIGAIILIVYVSIKTWSSTAPDIGLLIAGVVVAFVGTLLGIVVSGIKLERKPKLNAVHAATAIRQRVPTNAVEMQNVVE